MSYASDHGWSYGNGSYSGIMGQLQREEVEFTACGAMMRPDRMDAADVIVGIFFSR